MKKILFIMPLMAILLLASCNNGGGSNLQTTVTFSGESVGCTLYYNDVGYAKDTPITIPAGKDVILKIEPNQDYLPVFKDGLTVSEAIAYSFNPVKKEITIKVANNGKCVIKAVAETPKENLEAYKWSEISQLSEMGLADTYFDVYDSTKPTLNCKRVQLKHQDLDNDGEIDENEVYQTVRIIGFDTDYIDPNDRENTKVGITFEFADLISDASGYSLAAIWNNVPVTNANFRYDTSTIRECLNGNTIGNALWYEKEGTTKSNNYKDSVLNMLPDDLINVIVPVSKNVNINYDDGDGFKEHPVKDPLFLLTYKEMGYEELFMEIDVPVYQYYQGHTENSDPIRLKKQIKGAEGALTTTTTIEQSDLVSGNNGISYAGFNNNSSYATYKGNRYWLRNPDKNDTFNACCVDDYDATMNDFAVFIHALAVAPAFCV